MTEMLREAIEAVKQLPLEEQNRIAHEMLVLSGKTERLTKAELEAIAEGEADIKAGRIHTLEEIFERRDRELNPLP